VSERDKLKIWAKWIVRQNVYPDHACAECVPHSDILKPGYLCPYHEAKEFLAANESGQLETQACPFCKDDDFDERGLRMHLHNGWCPKF
jgi:hypothetical protein